MFHERIRLLASFAACALLAGCALDASPPDEDDESVATASEPIVNGAAVQSQSLLAKSTVAVWSPQGGGMWSNCTGVIVGWKYVITAAHCKSMAGGYVEFYDGPFPTGATRNVIDVDLPQGVYPGDEDYTDINGKFADIALLTLDGGIPSTSKSAELPLSYPGNNVSGNMVGRGRHQNCDPAWTCIDGQPNPYEELRYFTTTTYSSDNNDGHFLLNSANANKGDSGGPFFTYNSSTGRERVHGVLYGAVWEWAQHTKYTSVEFHLSWLLQRMSYTGGMIISDDAVRAGSTYSAFYNTDWRRCALACAQDSTCKSFSQWLGTVCELKNTTPSTSTLVGATSGTKWSL